jgi:hypothetical protein
MPAYFSGGAIESGAIMVPPAEAIQDEDPKRQFGRRKLFCPAKFRLSVRQ